MFYTSSNDILNELKMMFPQYDDEILLTSIRQFNGNIDNIVTYLISLNEERPQPRRTMNAHTSEIDLLERQYGIDLHKQWKTRLPDDFLIFESNSFMDDEQLARQLQNEFDEQASKDLLQSITNDQIYSSAVPQPAQPVQQAQPSQSRSESSFSSFRERTKKWKDKLVQLFNERKGYQRVSITEEQNNVEMEKL